MYLRSRNWKCLAVIGLTVPTQITNRQQNNSSGWRSIFDMFSLVTSEEIRVLQRGRIDQPVYRTSTIGTRTSRKCNASGKPRSGSLGLTESETELITEGFQCLVRAAKNKFY